MSGVEIVAVLVVVKAAVETVSAVLDCVQKAKNLSDGFKGHKDSSEEIKNYIKAAEANIISEVHAAELQERLEKIHVASIFWYTRALGDIAQFGITKESVEGPLEHLINDLSVHVSALQAAIDYFDTRPVPYANIFGSLLLAHNLCINLVLARKAFAYATTGQWSENLEVTYTLESAQSSINKWAISYVKSRKAQVGFSEVTHRGNQTKPFGPREKVHDAWKIGVDHGDQFIGSLVNLTDVSSGIKPFDAEHIVEHFWKTASIRQTIATLSNQYSDLGKQSRDTQAKLQLSSPPSSTFNAQTWYKIKNSLAGSALDVVNDGQGSAAGTIQMAAEGNFSGQSWQLRPHGDGSFGLCTMFLGAQMQLDVYGDDKSRPHLAPAGNYSGQQWQIEAWGDGSFHLPNSYSGPVMYLDCRDGSNEPFLDASNGTRATQHWSITPIGPVTESGFQV